MPIKKPPTIMNREEPIKIHKGGCNMVIYAGLALIIIALFQFLLAFVYFARNNYKLEKILLWTWSFNDKFKQIKDKEGYMKHQGKSCIVFGVFYLVIAVIIIFIENLREIRWLLYLLYALLILSIMIDSFRRRKYF